jgi:hypothetical protein
MSRSTDIGARNNNRNRLPAGFTQARTVTSFGISCANAAHPGAISVKIAFTGNSSPGTATGAIM